MTLAINKMDRCDHINTACHECPPKKTKVTQYSTIYRRTIQKTEHLVVKVSCGMRNDATKRRLAFSFTVIIQLSTVVKFHS